MKAKATKRNGKWKFTKARRAAALRNLKKAHKPRKARKTRSTKRRTHKRRH